MTTASVGTALGAADGAGYESITTVQDMSRQQLSWVCPLVLPSQST
jgi:hypothetical protein